MTDTCDAHCRFHVTNAERFRRSETYSLRLTCGEHGTNRKITRPGEERYWDKYLTRKKKKPLKRKG